MFEKTCGLLWCHIQSNRSSATECRNFSSRVAKELAVPLTVARTHTHFPPETSAQREAEYPSSGMHLYLHNLLFRILSMKRKSPNNAREVSKFNNGRRVSPARAPTAAQVSHAHSSGNAPPEPRTRLPASVARLPSPLGCPSQPQAPDNFIRARAFRRLKVPAVIQHGPYFVG